MRKSIVWVASASTHRMSFFALAAATGILVCDVCESHHPFSRKSHNLHHHHQHQKQPSLRSRSLLENSEEFFVPLVLDLLFIGEALASEIETLEPENARVMALCGAVQQQVRKRSMTQVLSFLKSHFGASLLTEYLLPLRPK
jgi:hypothetical protein